jgi:hypothetical protein
MAEITQAYSLINAMYQQATGSTSLTAVDPSSFVKVATTTLATGYDNFMNAMSQVLSESIFAWRPYDDKFRIIEADKQRFGNHVRKISPLDDTAVEDDEYSLADGYAKDPWTVRKPKVVQFNYYDKTAYSRWVTLPKHQIDAAVRSPEEFARFVAMVLGNMRNQIAQDREASKRLCFNNFVMGVYQDEAYSPNGRVYKLLSEYKTLTGQSTLTKADLFTSTHFMPFIQWASSRIMSISDRMTERGYLFHKNLTSTNIPRHTPKEFQKFAMMSDFYRMIEASAFSNTFHEQYIKAFGDFEPINYLQSSEDGSRDKITLSKFVSLNADGSIFTASAGSYELTDFVGIIFDRDAMLHTTINEWSQSTNMNPRGGYENLWYHYTHRYCNDFTENCAIFTLE